MTAAIDSATARYIARVKAIPALERDQELALARAYRAGDEEAGKRVIAGNVRHVVAQALRYSRCGVSLCDLIAQGNLGLTLALQRFDPERGLRFATYANHWIRSEMLGLATRAKTLVGAGRGPMRAKYSVGMRREHARLLSQLGDEAEVHGLLADRYNKSSEQIASMLYRSDAVDASLDTANRYGERPLVEQLAAADAGQEASLIEERSRGEIEAAVRQALISLNDRERFLVEHRLMADAEVRLSLSQVATRFGVSRERARQIEGQLKLRLRMRLQGMVPAEVATTSAPEAAAAA